jgi:hypothetical protein
VQRVGDPTSLTTAVTDGGFDPVPVIAQAGDSIEVVVRDAGGAVVLQQRVLVAAARPPIIVRTDPPPRKRDVPLNASLVIVFSEPIDAATLNASSVQLLRGTTPVAGTVGLLQGSATAAVFIPAAPLAASTSYELIVAQAVQDLSGDALKADATVQFTTGTGGQGSVATVSVVPSSAELLIGSQSQFTATAKDAQGNVLPGLPVTWTSGNPAVVTVSATGLATAQAEGITTISAEVEGIIGISDVTTFGLAFSVQPNNASAGTPITPAVVVTARDALGNTVTSFTGDVAIAIGANPGGGVLSGTTTVAADAGVATFASLSINVVAGIYTLTATSGLATTTSAAFAVMPGPATQLVFTVQPSTTAAGAVITPPIQVTAQDALGNTATAFSGDVTIAIGANPANAVLSGTTIVPSIAGVTTFSNLRISASGTGYTLIATAGTLVSGTSAPFDITPLVARGRAWP